jgi:NADH:ubiquinone oxidoreductase subunit E
MKLNITLVTIHTHVQHLDALKCVQRRNGWVDDAQLNAIALSQSVLLI